ncbi:hypothetical protein SAMN05216511_7294 [Streptomyces sp. KS_16]|nr:hypothetical protein BX261_7409 [Streptomyces sp. 2321.6]SDR62162.1 hypothetical protein SAMN05216511_7294 [Streptomyces sp. KS_16]SEE50731.1 hypothetical protein SAMN05428940_7343 [Streptomyces sp. 2133.1]SNC77829.1 hypothetical protein SAMN06272741_7245 [Streptomyces sp. 2114.4]
MNAYLVACYLKTEFPSRRTGRRRARQLRGEGAGPFDEYRCDFCGAVHIGHARGHATHLRAGPHGPVPLHQYIQERTP